MEHLFINDLNAGMLIDEIYMITQPVLRNTTRGDMYIAAYLSDKTGKANARMWSATEALFNALPTEGFVRIKGKTELYQSAMQIVVNDIIVVDSDQVTLSDFMPRTDKNISEMFEQLKTIVSKIINPTLKALTESFLADSDLMRKF